MTLACTHINNIYELAGVYPMYSQGEWS